MKEFEEINKKEKLKIKEYGKTIQKLKKEIIKKKEI